MADQRPRDEAGGVWPPPEAQQTPVVPRLVVADLAGAVARAERQAAAVAAALAATGRRVRREDVDDPSRADAVVLTDAQTDGRLAPSLLLMTGGDASPTSWPRHLRGHRGVADLVLADDRAGLAPALAALYPWRRRHQRPMGRP